MDEMITMSTKEPSRLEVLQRLKKKRLTQKEAATLLDLRGCALLRPIVVWGVENLQIFAFPVQSLETLESAKAFTAAQIAR